VLKHGPLANKTISWSDADDSKLMEAVILYRGTGRGGNVDWVKVCEYMGNDRTREQYCGRWNGVLKHREMKMAQALAASQEGGGGAVSAPASSSGSTTRSANSTASAAPDTLVTVSEVYQI
jgi:hypothetical protein